MPLYDYVCPQGHSTERLMPIAAVTVPCPCGQVATRTAVNRMAVIGNAVTPRDERNYRHSFREYSEAVAEVGDFYQRKRNDGDPVHEPNYLALAKNQARAAGAVVN